MVWDIAHDYLTNPDGAFHFINTIYDKAKVVSSTNM
jgi:hypothetical protein